MKFGPRDSRLPVKAAWRVSDPMVSANCGAPPILTSWSKPICTVITSPAMNAPAAPCPLPTMVRLLTTGATGAAPFTTKAAASATAWVPRASAAALPAPSAIVPPFSVSAAAPTAMPFASRSALTTG